MPLVGPHATSFSGQTSAAASFFYYNYSNNPNFNNKGDKIKILRI
jgi:hypothetical protein